MLHGVIAEGLTVACLAIVIIGERNNIQKVISKKYYKACLIFVLSFMALFFVHIILINHNSEELIRFYGLTKNICFPALMILAFGFVCRDTFPLQLVLFEMIIFNLIYTVAFFIKGSMDDVSFQLGSINGCSGIAIVLLPAAVMYLRNLESERDEYSRFLKKEIVAYVFIVTTIILVMLSDSLTSQLLLVIEMTAYLFSLLVRHIRIKQNFRGLIIFVFLGSIAVSLLIATGKIALDPNGLRTRVGIWTRAYNQFTVNKDLQFVFGTGNDIVHMLTKDLEAHNMYLEILMIHGVAGLLLAGWFIIYTIKMLLEMDTQRLKPFYLSFTIYIVICCLHPFYTGLSPFQFNCVVALISLLFMCRAKQID